MLRHGLLPQVRQEEGPMTKKTSSFELDIPPAHVFLASMSTYVLPKGKVGQRNSLNKKYLCWQKDGNWIYYTCTSCRAVTRMTVNLKPAPGTAQKCCLFMDGNMVATHGCEYCCACSAHVWLVLEDFPVRTIQEKIAKNSRQCPMCNAGDISSNSGFKYCCRCGFHWHLPKNNLIGASHADQGG